LSIGHFLVFGGMQGLAALATFAEVEVVLPETGVEVTVPVKLGIVGMVVGDYWKLLVADMQIIMSRRIGRTNGIRIQIVIKSSRIDCTHLE
jgi:hypothetical protein